MSNNVTCTNQEIPFLPNDRSGEIHKLQCKIYNLEHDLFYLYVFLTSQEICEEASAFLENHEEDPLPFRLHY